MAASRNVDFGVTLSASNLLRFVSTLPLPAAPRVRSLLQRPWVKRRAGQPPDQDPLLRRVGHFPRPVAATSASRQPLRRMP